MQTQRDNVSDSVQSETVHQVIQRGDYDDIQFLIESGQSLDDLDEQGLTVLSALFNENTLFGFVATYEEIRINDYANRESYLYIGDEHYAKVVDEGDGFLALVRLLLAYDVDPNVVDAKGATPLHWASYYGLKGVVDALLDAGADPTAQDVKGQTPRDYAHESHQLDIGERLLNEERKQAVCRRLDDIDALGYPSPLDISMSGFLSLKDMTFFSSVATPESIQRFFQDKINPVNP